MKKIFTIGMFFLTTELIIGVTWVAPIAHSKTPVAAQVTETPPAGSTSPTLMPSMSSSPSASSSPSGSPAACSPNGTTLLTVSAKNVAFDTNCLASPANTPFKIVFDNQDAVVPHNVAIFTDPSATKPLFTGALVTGPRTVTYVVHALPAGTYYFRCNVHPTQMFGTFFVK